MTSYKVSEDHRQRSNTCMTKQALLRNTCKLIMQSSDKKHHAQQTFISCRILEMPLT
jgi:hypothetical protein